MIGQCNGLQPLAVASPPMAAENFIIGSWHPLGYAGKEPVGDFLCHNCFVCFECFVPTLLNLRIINIKIVILRMTAPQHTGLAARQLTAQTTFDHVVDVLVQHFIPDMVAHLGSEGIHQQNPRVGLADTALAHIEHRLLVELARGGAMRAFHIVSVNLQKWLAVDFSRRGEDDVAVILVSIRLLRALCHIDMAVEDARGLIVQNTLELLVAGAVRHVVVHLQIVLHMLLLIDEIEAIDLGISTFAIKIDGIRVVDVAAVEGNDHNFQAAVGQLPNLELTLDGSLIVHVLQHVQLKAGIFVEDDFGHFRLRRQMRIIVIFNDFAALVGSNDELVVHNQSSLIHS